MLFREVAKSVAREGSRVAPLEFERGARPIKQNPTLHVWRKRQAELCGSQDQQINLSQSYAW